TEGVLQIGQVRAGFIESSSGQSRQIPQVLLAAIVIGPAGSRRLAATEYLTENTRVGRVAGVAGRIIRVIQNWIDEHVELLGNIDSALVSRLLAFGINAVSEEHQRSSPLNAIEGFFH